MAITARHSIDGRVMYQSNVNEQTMPIILLMYVSVQNIWMMHSTTHSQPDIPDVSLRAMAVPCFLKAQVVWYLPYCRCLSTYPCSVCAFSAHDRW